MQTLKPTLTIDIWSDLVCPWCWIAKKRFEQGLNRFEFRDQVVLRHHSYRLAGGTPAMPFKDAIVKKLGSQHSAELMMNQVGTAGKSEGLIYTRWKNVFITAVSPKVALSLTVSSSLQWP